MRKIFSTSTLILGIVFFVLFMVAACAAYYMTAGVFVTSQIAILYAALGLLGALGVVFRFYVFSILFYLGCALGWMSGQYIASLQGDFAPQAGIISTFFMIGAFSLIGLLFEIKRQRRHLRKKAEAREAERMAEEARKQQALQTQKESPLRTGPAPAVTPTASAGPVPTTLSPTPDISSGSPQQKPVSPEVSAAPEILK